MASRGVSVLKFVGTVSLGVLTGVSYTLSSLTIPALLTLPSASTAARTFEALTTAATRHLRSLAAVSSSAFALAYLLSPRPFRHPYLLYVSVLVLGSHAAASDLLAPYLLSLGPASPSSAAEAAAAKAAAAAAKEKQRKLERARARMEASYEVLGSDAQSESASAGEEEAEAVEGTPQREEEEEEEGDAGVNGEGVRAEVELFLKKQIMRGAVAGLGFLLSVVGIWGDGVVPVYAAPVVVEV